MPRDYAKEYADLANLYKRASAKATSPNDAKAIQRDYDDAVREIAVEQQREAQMAKPKTAAPRPLTMAEEAKGPLRAAAQGLTLGFGEEIEALPYAVPGGETSAQARQRIRGEMARYREARPAVDIGANIAGAVGLGYLTGGLSTTAAPGASLLQRAATVVPRVVRSPLASGIVAGAGTAEGGIPERMAGATVGGIAGKSMGYAGGKAAGAIGRALERAQQGVKIAGPGVGTTTIARLAQQYGIEDLPAALRAAQEAAPEARVMDVLGTPGQRAATGIRLIGGRPGQVIERAMTERVESAPQRLMQALGATGRKRENIVRAVDDLIEEGDIASKPLYQAFEQSEEKAIPKLDAILETPFGRQVIERARRIAGNERRQFIEPGIPARPSPVLNELGQPARIVAAEPAKYNPRTLDDIKKAMDAVIYDGKYGRVEAGQGGVSPVELQAIKKLRRQFINAVDSAYPETYAAARQTWAGSYAARTALEDGIEAAGKRINPDALAKSIAELEPSEQEFFRRGFIERIAQRIDDNQLKPSEISSEGFRKRMQSVFGNEADDIVTTLREQTKLTQSGQRIMAGSPTAERQRDIADIEGPLVSGKFIRAFGERVRTAARAAEAAESRFRAPLSELKRMRVATSLMRPVSEAESIAQSLRREQEALRRGERYRQMVESPLSRFISGRTIGAFSTTPPAP